MSELELIEATLARTARRRRLERAIRGAWQGLAAGAAAWVLILAVHKLAPVPDWVEWRSWILLPVSLAAGFVWGWARKQSMEETARWIDGQKDLKERLSTALEFGRNERNDEWRKLLVTDAAQSISGLNEKELLPFTLPAVSRWALLLLILGVGLGFVPEYRSKAYVQKKTEAAAIQQAGKELAQLTKRNLQARPPALETTKNSLEQVGELGEHMSKAQLTRNEALKELANVTEKLKDQARDMMKDPALRKMERAARSSARGASPSADLQQKMDALAKQLGAKAADSDALDKMKQDLEKAKEMARNLPKGDSAEAKAAEEKLNAQLADMAQQAKDLGLDLPSLSEGIAALQQAQPDQVLKDLEVAEVELEKMAAMAKALEKMQMEAQKMGKDLAEQLKQGQMEAAQGTLQKMMKQLQESQLTPEEMKKMMEEVAKALEPSEQYGEEVGDQMQAAMNQMKQGSQSEAAQALGKASEALGKMMGELGDAQSLLATLEGLQQAQMMIANGQGWMQGQQGRPGRGRNSGQRTSRGGVGTWTDEDSWEYPEYTDTWDNTGIERPDEDGRGVSDRGEGQLADNLAPTKLKGQITPGGPMPSITMKGVSIKGTSKIEVQNMDAAAQSDAQAALNQDQVPRAYQNAVRNYFDDLKE